MRGFVFRILFLFLISGALAQDIQVNRQNKTIAVTADESVTADPEVAVLAIGYHNYAPNPGLGRCKTMFAPAMQSLRPTCSRCE
jgi:hypothetical protein